MKLNQLAKALMIAVPALALSACSTTSETSADSQSATNQQQQAQGQGAGVELGSANQILTPDEVQRQKYAELRQDYILYFDFDRSDVRPEFAEMLEAHAAFLIENPSTQILVEGHADERGTPEYNIALGERRAKAVERYLQGLGVMGSQITVVSYGEEKPLDSSATDAAHAKNRRAVLVY